MKKIKRVTNGPVNLGGMLGRIVQFEDDSGCVQTWDGTSKGWVYGGTDVAEILGAPPAMLERLIEYGVPEEDWLADMLEDWRREQRSKGK